MSSPLLQDLKTGPNILSLFRLFAALPLYFLISNDKFAWSFLLFLAGAATDLADGWTARHQNKVTCIGKALDPAADKVFFLTTSFFLVPGEFIWWWGALFALEWKLFAIGVWAFLKQNQGRFKLGANRWGKIKVWAEVTLIVFLFINTLEPIKASLLKMLFTASIILAGLSLIKHIRFGTKK